MNLPHPSLPDFDRTTLRQALVGGGIATLVMAVGVLTVGLSGISQDARALVSSTIPIAQALFTTAMIASSTTLALMLTMLGMTADQTVKSGFYGQIRQAATLAVSVFTAATVLVLVLVIPFEEGNASPTTYTVLYYVITGAGALIGGALVAVMITLHGAVLNLVGLVDPEAESDIAASEE